MEENDWRSELSTELRQDVVNDIVEAATQTVKPSLLQVTLPSIQKLAVKFEENVYSLAKDKSSYLSRIAAKLREIKKSSNATMSSSSSNSSFSTEIPSDPEAQNSQSQVHKQDQSFTIHDTGLANQHQEAQQHLQMNFKNKVTSAPAMLSLASLPSTSPPDSGLTQVPKPNISLNENLKDSPGDLQKSEENLKGEKEHSGNSGNCEKHEQGRLHLPQAIAQQNPDEFLNFQQDSCLELQSSTVSMGKRDPQTTSIQHQQTPKAPSALHNLPSMVEPPLSPLQQKEQPKGQKLVATDARQNQLTAQESRVPPDLQHQQQPKSPCLDSDCQSLQSRSQTPEQKLLSQSQPPKLQPIPIFSQQDKQKRSQTSGNINSTSVMKQEGAYQKAESSRSKRVNELKEMCQRAINILRQAHSQTPQAILPEDQKKPPLQSMNPQSSAITLQNSNTTKLGDDSMEHSSEPAISQKNDIESEQYMCESNSKPEIMAKPEQQVFMRFVQPPLSTPQQPNGDNLLSQNHRNGKGVKNSRRSSSVAQRMHPKQRKPLHHTPAQTKKQESQQRQMGQQFIKGNPEVPQQLQLDHEMPHQLNEVNDVKMPQGIEHETSLNQRPEGKNLKFRQVTAVKSGVLQGASVSQHQHLKNGVPLSISSPWHIQTAPVRFPQHSPSTNQHNLLQSQKKVGSPSHSVNSQPGFSAKFLSNNSSYLNNGDCGFGASNINSGGSCDAEQPILRLIKAVNSISSEALSASVSEIGSFVNLADSMAGAVPVYGSKGSVSEDLGATSKTNPLSRYFSMGCNTFGMRKMKRSTNAVPWNAKTPACPEKSDLESTTFCHIKKARIQVSHALLKEIEEINQKMIDTVVDISDEQTDSTTVGTNGGGIIIKCSFIAVSISRKLSSKEDLAQISKIQPLKLLVPKNYPCSSPIVLENLPEEVSEKHDSLSVKARLKLKLHLRNLLQPMSVGEIARTWDICVRAVISDYAVKNGGGSVFSKYGTWENCFSA